MFGDELVKQEQRKDWEKPDVYIPDRLFAVGKRLPSVIIICKSVHSSGYRGVWIL